MFIAVYRFVVRDGLEQRFHFLWSEVTQGIYQELGSLGSQLHQDAEGNFVGLAKWPSHAAFLAATSKTLSSELEHVRESMRSILDTKASGLLTQLQLLDDQWQSRPFIQKEHS